MSSPVPDATVQAITSLGMMEIKCPVSNPLPRSPEMTFWKAERSIYNNEPIERPFAASDTTVVITHSPCNDGYGAAMAARYLLGDKAEYYGAAPGDKFDWSEITESANKNIVFADIAPPFPIFEKLVANGNKVLILDHHKTQQQDMALVPEANKVFDMNHSGAYLAWAFFHPEKPVPRLIELIEKRDLWKKDEPDVDLLFEYLYIQDGRYERYVELIDANKLAAACIKGQALVDKRDYEVPRIVKRAGLKISQVNGKTELIAYVNTDQYLSDVGNALVKRFPADYAVVWKYNDRWNSVGESLRSMPTGADVSVIAKCFNGGGHSCSSGVGFGGLNYLHDKDGISVSPTLVRTAWNTLSEMRNNAIYAVIEAFGDVISTEYRKLLFHPQLEELLQYNRNGMQFDDLHQRLIVYMALDLYILDKIDKNSMAWLTRMNSTIMLEWVEKFHSLDPYACKNMRAVLEHIRTMPYYVDLRSHVLEKRLGNNPALNTAMRALDSMGSEIITLTHFTDKLNQREWKKVDSVMREAGLTPLFADDLTPENQAGVAELQKLVRSRWNATLLIETMNRDQFVEKFGAL
jgi:oligoribonuclease NrnB/cAMP/cGMP phosphodiesterase (DHH superfamily)